MSGGTRCTCGSGCLTFGACVRRKNLRVGQVDATRQRHWDRELDLYASARSQGVKPAGTSTHATRHALDQSDQLGRPYDAAKGPLQGGDIT